MLKKLSISFLFLLITAFAHAQSIEPGYVIESGQKFDTKRIIALAAEHNLDLGAIQNPMLFSAIDEWYGTPYRYSGESKNGIDCSGFVTVLYNKIHNLQLTGGSRDIYTRCAPVSKNDLKEGDLLFFTINKKRISHVGYYLSNNKFIHAATRGGVLISDLEEPYYKRYFYRAGRIEKFFDTDFRPAM